MADIDKVLEDTKEYAKQKAIRDLLEEGVDENFVLPLLDKLRSAVLTRAAISDITDELKQYVIGDNKKGGILERYVKQVHSDSLTQYIANYTEILTVDAGLEFYIYLGNRQGSTRCFCDERAGNYYHRKEIEAWGNGEDLGECDLGGGTWAGMIAGTNASNIFTYRGGWNCEHQIVPTLTALVPQDVIDRAKENGYI